MKVEKLRAIVMLLSALMLAAAGCGKKPQTSPPAPTNASAGGVEKIKQEAKDAVTATTGYLTQQKERLQKSLSDKMTDLTKQLSDLKAKSERTGDKARSEWTNALAALQQKKQLAADKLEQLKNSSSDKWQEFKAEVEAAVADLEKALKDPLARSKNDDKSGRQ
ncbi:MAG: hypothetical protein DME24_11205 [Verrucomicrobia bacterium]|nr:MAG: hypothetical protein DME24_11205 [Verrucomicrobiota bacterium]